ncbi:NfeD family protein [Methylonatrum kenyense]|uniref:NfeD family protein n=1 Tax=Methylonatrum kenyense TaxID=455253 RepID=UPI0020C15EF4|nr:NfeD family protein [Methylonatrum kenyense]MCK8514958.1 NfeD family protein [Methylonatrum kenyense]
MPETFSPALLVTAALGLLVLDVLAFGGASVILPIIAVGILAAAGAGAMGLEPIIQLSVGAVASLLSVPLVVFLSRWLRQSRKAASDDQRLLDDIFAVQFRGSQAGIRHRADFLPAHRDDGVALQDGDKVRVLRIEGVTAIVRPAGKPSDNAGPG